MNQATRSGAALIEITNKGLGAWGSGLKGRSVDARHSFMKLTAHRMRGSNVRS